MSENAKTLLRNTSWCDCQFGELLSPSREAYLMTVWLRMRDLAAHIIGWQAS